MRTGACLCGFQIAFKLLTRQPRHLIKRTGFFEQVGRAGDDNEALFAAEHVVGDPVDLDNLIVVATDDEQRGRSDMR